MARVGRLATTVTAVAYAGALYWSGFEFDSITRWLLGLLPTLVVGAIFALDAWLWRVPGVARIVGRPRVYGTWLATLTPREGSAIPDGGNWGPIHGAVVIEQSLWSVSVHLRTDESPSHSTATQFLKRDQSKQRQRLVYTYQNTPIQQHQPRSSPHAGAAEFEVVGADPDFMSGTYWTARLTVGDIQLRKLDHKTDRADLASIRAAAQSASIEWP